MQIRTTKAENGYVVETTKTWSADGVERFYNQIYVAKDRLQLVQLIGDMFLKAISENNEYTFELP